MTTDKDEAGKLVKYAYKAIRFDKAAFVVTDFIPPVEKEIARIRTESAEQARKEAADKHCALCKSVNGTQCPLPEECLYRAAILGNTVKEGKTDAEKLAIAIDSLKFIRASCHDGFSLIYRACNGALNEICE